MRSNSLELDIAFSTPNSQIMLSSRPTPAQFGALRCHENLGRRTNRTDWDDPTDDSSAALTQLWEADQATFWDEFAETIRCWASTADASAGAAIGYWLTWARAHGIRDPHVERLTRFLAEPRFPPRRHENRSVRRYPTGGISEKQAIVLPAILRLLSEGGDFHSSFLIARRLGHTGGTSDKLRVLPGFSLQPASVLSGWDGSPPRVRYFTADARFCPRDEVLYFLRGETGTVRQLGLIVASIVSKQFALQADLTLLDVLHGDGAFFPTVADAMAFQLLARRVCISLKLPIEFSIRPTSSVAWRSIGNATEIAEVLDLLGSPSATGIPPRSELGQARVFAARLAAGQALSGEDVRTKIEDAWHNGELLKNLFALWSEHDVLAPFIEDVKGQGSGAILSGLRSVEVLASKAGLVRSKSVVELADLVNNRLNTYKSAAGGLPQTPGIGGLTLGAALGERVERGRMLFRVYSTDDIDPQLIEDLNDNLQIVAAAA